MYQGIKAIKAWNLLNRTIVYVLAGQNYKLDIIIPVEKKNNVQLEYFSSIPNWDRWRSPNLSTQNIKFKIRISLFDFQSSFFKIWFFKKIKMHFFKMLTKIQFWHLSFQAKYTWNIDPAMHNFFVYCDPTECKFRGIRKHTT